MIYVMSDIHSRIDLFDKMLEQIGLTQDDTLYILGDSVDRGGGIAVLQKIMKLSERYNVVPLMGNHEEALLACVKWHMSNARLRHTIEMRNSYQRKDKSLKQREDAEKALIDKSSDLGSKATHTVIAFNYANQRLKNMQNAVGMQEKARHSAITANSLNGFDNWETVSEYEALSKREREAVKSFVSALPQTATVQVGEDNYLLVHGGLYKGQDGECSYYPRHEFFMEPVDKELLAEHGCPADTRVIFGHTTTRDLNIWTNHVYKAPNTIWYDETHKDKIGIDCGASYPNGQLACLRLDDMREFYVRNEDRFITPISKVNRFFRENKREWMGKTTAN